MTVTLTQLVTFLQVGVALVTLELSSSSEATRPFCSKYFSGVEVQASACYFSSGSVEEDSLFSLEEPVLHPPADCIPGCALAIVSWTASSCLTLL